MAVSISKHLQLNTEQLQALRELYQTTENVDGHKIKNYWNIVTTRQAIVPCDVLAYQEGKLVGYIGVFNFTPDETEFCTIVHPDYRQQGIFRHLLAEAREIAKSWEIKTVLLPCSQDAEIGKQVLNKLQTTYTHSEISMELVLPWQSRDPNTLPIIDVLAVQEEDILTMALLDQACFKSNYQEMVNRYTNSFHETNRYVALAAIKDDVIGKIHVRFEEGTAYIHDFCVIPQYQGKGYGTAILIHTLKFLLKHGHDKICLDVVYTNHQAIKLYQNNGFQVTAAFDFWRLII